MKRNKDIYQSNKEYLKDHRCKGNDMHPKYKIFVNAT